MSAFGVRFGFRVFLNLRDRPPAQKKKKNVSLLGSSKSNVEQLLAGGTGTPQVSSITMDPRLYTLNPKLHCPH